MGRAFGEVQTPLAPSTGEISCPLSLCLCAAPFHILGCLPGLSPWLRGQEAKAAGGVSLFCISARPIGLLVRTGATAGDRGAGCRGCFLPPYSVLCHRGLASWPVSRMGSLALLNFSRGVAGGFVRPLLECSLILHRQWNFNFI